MYSGTVSSAHPPHTAISNIHINKSARGVGIHSKSLESLPIDFSAVLSVLQKHRDFKVSGSLGNLSYASTLIIT